MRFARSLQFSAGALLRHKLRTALALGGLVIGVAVVMVMVGIGEGAKHQVLLQIERLGADMLVVTAGESTHVAWRPSQGGRVPSLSLADARAIEDLGPGVLHAAPVQSAARRVKLGALSTMTTVLGTTPEFQFIRNARIDRGRYFTLEENERAARVAIVGARIVEKVFEGVDPIGIQIRIGKVPFTVIGILKPKGSSIDGTGDEDNQVVIPIKTALRRVFNVNHLDLVYVKAAGEAELPLVAADIGALLRKRHELDYLRRPDDFKIEEQDLALRAKRDAASSFTSMIIGMAGISLFVGGMGILSIMIITIRERVGEIGLRMAIGARPRDIIQQFILEALMLGMLGGLLGLLLGLGTSYGVGEATEWSTYVPLNWILGSIGASLCLGLAAGVYPAMRAARMNPIDALRAE